MKRKIFLLFICLSSGFLTFSQNLNNDPFLIMMDKLKISEENLGWTPKGYWMRYPIPQDIPFKTLAFNDLFSEPQRIYDYVKTMAISVEDFLHPDYLSANRDGIMRVGFFCGIMNQTEQFRAFSASLWAKPIEKDPLLNAIKEIYLRTNTVFEYNRIEQAGEFPLIEKDLRLAIKNIDPKVQTEIARAIYNMLDAWQSQQNGMRNVDYQDAVKCWRLRTLGETQFDGMEYYTFLEDVAKDIDINSIYYAGVKLMAVSEQLSDSIEMLMEKYPKIDWKLQNLNIVTPIGRIVLSGTKNDIHNYNDALLVVDFGGNDKYLGAIGSTPSLNIPVSLCVDMEGNDTYDNDDEYIPSQGAAIMGAAMLYDLKGNDTYNSKKLSQGAALLGIGILADLAGDDEYNMWTSGQGAAYFGIGLAIDNSGNDKYYLFGDGQGYGGIGGGIGTLINRTGNDYYFTEPDTAKIFRSDFYHSFKGQYNYSYSQGCGVGRRGDITDGHSWAGGQGSLIDLEGNDTYIAGGWAQGCGYWYGSGFLYDGTGNDIYKSTGWSQAAGAHFCIGAMFDEAGDDQYSIWEKLAAGMAFGHDYTIAILYNKGGNDSYKLKDDGLGYAINKSQVFFFDTEGDDIYTTQGDGHNYGITGYDRNNPPDVSSTYHLYSDQICLFGDLGGNDKYIMKNFETNKEVADTAFANGSEVFSPAEEEKAKQVHKRNYGLGIDFSNLSEPSIYYFTDKIKHRFKEFK